MIVRVYTARHQPATRFCDVVNGRPLWFQCRRRALQQTACCRRRRWAVYTTVQVYYDSILYWCRPGRGCRGKEEGEVGR